MSDKATPGEETLPADEQLARELVERARTEGVELVGPGGLLTDLTKSVLETALEVEIEDHLGYPQHAPAGRNTGNSRNGPRSQTVLTEGGRELRSFSKADDALYGLRRARCRLRLRLEAALTCRGRWPVANGLVGHRCAALALRSIVGLRPASGGCVSDAGWREAG